MITKIRLKFIRHAYWTLLSSLVGLLSGVAASVFLISLDWVTRTRDQNQKIILALPVVGLFIGLVYHHFGKDSQKGNNLILDEIHNPQKVIPLRMAPLVLGGTLLTHLFGGSVGREGTAVQMGASLSDQLSRFFTVTDEERKILLTAGAGAGFGAAIGAPWAGVIFGMEVINVGRLRLFAWFECLVASFIGYYTTQLLHAPHSHFQVFEFPQMNFEVIAWVLLAGVGFGFAARLFSLSTHFVENLMNKWIHYPPLKPLIGGIVVVALFYLEGSFRYVGLGIPYIQDALANVSSARDPILKSIFTSLTIGTGFKGGEFIPLVFIGTTLGSALSAVIPISYHLLASVGFAAVFAGASNTPIACSIMAIEIFGPQIAPFAIAACFASYYSSGHSGIYKSQKIYFRKHHRFMMLVGWLGEIPRRFFNGKKGS